MLNPPNNMRVKFLIVFLFIGLISEAQVAGYLGKRFSVGYSNYFMLAGIGPTANSTSAIGEPGLNTTHCVNFEYTIKNRTNFCVSIQKSNTGMDPGGIYVQEYDGYNNPSYNLTYAEKPYKPMQISSFNIGFGFKFFQSGTLAPIGKYKKLELLMLFNNLVYKKNGFLYYDSYSNQYAYKSIGSGDYNFNTIAISYTMGRSRVVFDRLVLDYGLRLGFVPAGVLAVVNADGDFFTETSSNSYNTFNERDFRNHTNIRLFRYQIVNLHLGLSFLAF